MRLAWLGCALALCVSCNAATSKNGAGLSSSGAGGVAASGGSDAAGGVVTAGGNAPIIDVDPDKPMNGCSDDQRSVIDPAGTIVTTCTDDELCASGSCVSACSVAASGLTSAGCDFYAAQPDRLGCFSVFVANTWHAPVQISAEFAGSSLDLGKMARLPSGSGPSLSYAPLPGGLLPPGEVAILFLDHGVCPAAAMVDAPETRTGVSQPIASSIDHAVHITTDRPVTAYSIAPYGGGAGAVTSSTMLLPTSTWDTNYLAFDVFQEFMDRGIQTQIVAKEDATEVSILTTGSVVAGSGVSALAKGATQTFTLNHGEMLELGTHDGLTGSPISANKPIGVWGATDTLGIPKDQIDTDTGHVQVPPLRALGSRYVGVRYRNRLLGTPEEAPPWRIMAVVDGTELSYEPAAPAGAPTKLDAGEVAMFDATGPFIVKSQGATHPFYVVQHMTGCRVLDPFMPEGCPGGPETVNVIPAEQYLRDYVFFTDPTYPETTLTVIRKRDTDGAFKDVELDCAGVLSGWQPVGKDFEYTYVDLVRGDFEKQGMCDNGRHRMKSDAEFALTVWGFGLPNDYRAASYGYPAGAGVREVTQVRVPVVPK